MAGVEDYEFEIEDALAKQLGARPMPFPGMDSECFLGRLYQEWHALAYR